MYILVLELYHMQYEISRR